jgi:hypothetical protein
MRVVEDYIGYVVCDNCNCIIDETVPFGRSQGHDFCKKCMEYQDAQESADWYDDHREMLEDMIRSKK